MMRRILLGLLGGYVLAGVITSVAEINGVLGRSCGCVPDCWCKRPGMNMFRWVTPKSFHQRQNPGNKQKPGEGEPWE